MRGAGAARGRQQGVILVVVLVFLLVFGAASLHAFRAAQVAERLAGNQWDRARAFEAAEAGLRDGRTWLARQAEIFPPEGGGDSGVYRVGTLSGQVEDPRWNWAEGRSYGALTGADPAPFADHRGPPHWVVEAVGWSRDDLSPEHSSAGYMTFYYAVSSRGLGPGSGTTDGAQAVVQAVVAKRFR